MGHKERMLSKEQRAEFLELIEPYLEKLVLITQGKARLTDKDKIQKYADIYNTYVKDPASELLSIGCNTCISKSIPRTLKRYELENAVDDKETTGKKMTFPKQEPEVKTLLNTTDMKWGEFKKYCTSKGIVVKGKKRVELEEELKNL